MQVHSKAAKRYAKALFDLASQANEIDKTRADVDAILQLLRSNPELARFMNNYMLPASARSRVIAEIFSNRVTPLIRRFINLLEEKKRCGIINQICTSFIDLHDALLGIVKGKITSPLAFEQVDVQILTSYAQTKTKGHLALETIVEPSLLGGFKLRLGDVVYDASVAAQLHMLKEKMISV